jgi:hypothetical protein
MNDNINFCHLYYDDKNFEEFWKIESENNFKLLGVNNKLWTQNINLTHIKHMKMLDYNYKYFQLQTTLSDIQTQIKIATNDVSLGWWEMKFKNELKKIDKISKVPSIFSICYS